MKKMKKAMMPLMMAAMMTGCDLAERKDFNAERSDSTYRAAMDDYRAGRIASAIKGLEATCRKDPANASARFQLACLLQDSAKDYFGAACAYREYLLQHPKSEKAKLARERLGTCEKELARELASRFGLNKAQDSQQELELKDAAIKKERDRANKAERDLTAAMQRVSALVLEVSRLKKTFDAHDAAEDDAPRVTGRDIMDAKSLLDGDDDAAPVEGGPSAADARLLADDDDALARGSDILNQPKDAKAKREADRKAREAEKARVKAGEPPHEARPDSYVIQEGDTLYRIAMRFYGTRTAWSKIRDANKAVISMDGRVRKGQRIVLPK